MAEKTITELKEEYKKIRDEILENEHVADRVLTNRFKTIRDAMGKTRDGESCPRDCAFHGKNFGTKTCAALVSTYQKGQCPFYRPIKSAYPNEEG